MVRVDTYTVSRRGDLAHIRVNRPRHKDVPFDEKYPLCACRRGTHKTNHIRWRSNDTRAGKTKSLLAMAHFFIQKRRAGITSAARSSYAQTMTAKLEIAIPPSRTKKVRNNWLHDTMYYRHSLPQMNVKTLQIFVNR